MRADCGCPIDTDGQVLHGIDGPCSIPGAPGPTIEDYCAANGHQYHGDDAGLGRCYCGSIEYPPGGPT